MNRFMIRRKKIIPVFLFFTILAAARSSAQDNPLFRHLPPNATSIIHLNVPVIAGKMNLQELMGSFPNSGKKPGTDIADLLKDLTEAGVDAGRDVFLTETRQASPDSAIYMTLLVHLRDSARFLAFLRKEEADRLRIVLYPGKIFSASERNMGAAWNKDLAVIVSVSKGVTGGGTPVNRAYFAAKRSLASLAGYDKSFYTTDPDFRAGFSDGADIQIWTEQGNALSMLTRKFMPPTLPGNSPFTTAADKPKGKSLISIRFGTGKITFQSHVYFTAGTATGYAGYKNRPMDISLLAHVPKGNLLGFFSLNVDLLLTGEMMKKFDTHHKLDTILARKHLSLVTILHAFKGDLLLAALEPVQEDPAQKPKVPVYLVIPINDLSAFNSVAAAYKATQDSTKADSSGQKPGLFGKMKLVSGLKNNLLVVSTSQENVDAYLNNTENRSTDFLTGEMKQNSFSMLIDFKILADFVHHMSAQPSGKDKKMSDILDALDKLVVTSGVKEGKMDTYFELKFTDQGQNSLKTLVQLMH
ncbi:MAG TPA: DUF4836 family protein [Puia sp.]|nr:DUF4836 family protein [Puia sp.]